MTPELRRAVATQLGREVISARDLHGGDIHAAFRVELRGGDVLFVKSSSGAPRGMFTEEARGLAWLRSADALRIPSVLAIADGAEGPRFLALEYLDPGPRDSAFDEKLGRGLVGLHRVGAPGFGFDHDNYIGSLPQSNRAHMSWAAFYREERLQPLVRRAIDRRVLDASATARFEPLFARLESLVGPAEPPARLHGDLWGGNLHADERGQPCLIDPAVYGGHREIDLAMMRLFGGFGPRVFAAYNEAWPLAHGHEARVALYQLYPLLVHVNLFGGAYAASALRALDDAMSA
ncbi:MAG TPA: fructosamine kinase family protein [Polyangiaceae bacterium]|nr:fructosamine kinase family protein [Polyangiaceae bacterium]